MDMFGFQASLSVGFSFLPNINNSQETSRNNNELVVSAQLKLKKYASKWINVPQIGDEHRKMKPSPRNMLTTIIICQTLRLFTM